MNNYVVILILDLKNRQSSILKYSRAKYKWTRWTDIELFSRETIDSVVFLLKPRFLVKIIC